AVKGLLKSELKKNNGVTFEVINRENPIL
ncbi:MAG: hypothetical protein ACI93E_000771, partial [Flavobacteriales bacterium]